MAPQLTAMKGPGGPGGLVVHEPGDALLARPAFAGDEHGGIHLGHPPRQVHDLAHRRRSWPRRPGAVGQLGRQLDQRPAMLAELLLGLLQGLGDPVQGHVEAVLEAVGLEEPQFLGVLLAPLLAGAPEQVAAGVARCPRSGPPGRRSPCRPRGTEVAADEPADGPADGRVGPAEMEEVLLRLVGGRPASRPSRDRGSVLPGSTLKRPSRAWMRVPALAPLARRCPT